MSTLSARRIPNTSRDRAEGSIALHPEKGITVEVCPVPKAATDIIIEKPWTISVEAVRVTIVGGIWP